MGFLLIYIPASQQFSCERAFQPDYTSATDQSDLQVRFFDANLRPPPFLSVFAKTDSVNPVEMFCFTGKREWVYWGLCREKREPLFGKAEQFLEKSKADF